MSWPSNPQAPAQTGAPPTCYRHPGRETYVSCQRCGRPICPDCMQPASVGFHCPQCVAEGSATVRAPRSALGARLRAGTPVTYGLIALCVLVYLGQRVDPGLTGRFFLYGGAPGSGGVAGGQPYRLLTAVFLHESLLHIGFNMMSLWFIGRPLESALGRARYLGVFVVGGLAGSATAYWLTDPAQPSLGASGAVFALFGTLLVIARSVHADLRSMIGILVLNLVFSFTGGISWQAHVGGLVAGLLLGLVLVRAPRGRRAAVTVGAFVVVLVVLAVAVATRTADLGGSLL